MFGNDRSSAAYGTPVVIGSSQILLTRLAKAMALVVSLGIVLFLTGLFSTSPAHADNRKDRDGNSVTHYHWNQTRQKQEKWNGARVATGDIDPRVAKAAWAAGNLLLAAAYPNATKGAGPTAVYNCHGFTFANEQVWIDNDEVQDILDAGYNEVSKPYAVGDVAVYKTAGIIGHTGKVSTVASGQITEVEGKWGTGGTYKHAPGYGPYGAVDEVWRRKAGAGLAAPRSPILGSQLASVVNGSSAGEAMVYARGISHGPVVSWPTAPAPALVQVDVMSACNSAASVGGIAELPDAATAPLAASDSSGTNAAVLAGAVAGAVAVGAVTLGGAAWYARRRTR